LDASNIYNTNYTVLASVMKAPTTFYTFGYHLEGSAKFGAIATRHAFAVQKIRQQ
jgi:hypothetical protein